MTFLAQVIEHLIAKYGIEHLDQLTIVVPSRRAMLYIKEYIRNYLIKHSIKDAIQIPQLTTLSILMDELSPLYKIDEIQAVCTLYRVYVEVLREAEDLKHSNVPLERFYGWGKQLVQDFSNIDKAYPLATSQSILDNTAAARQLEELKLDKDVYERLLALVSNNPDKNADDSRKREFELLWKQLPTIYSRYRQALGEYGYEGARMESLLTHWNEESVQSKLRGRMFVFAGFNYLVPAEKAFMHRLQDAKQAVFYWDYPTNFTTNEKAFYWIEKNAKEFVHNEYIPQSWQPKDVEVISTASAHAQAQYVHEWLLANHHKGERTAVVICDESILEQVIYALPVDKPDDSEKRFEHINITKGFPMRQTDVFANLMNKLTESDDINIAQLKPELPQIPPEEIVNMTWHDMLEYESTFQMRASLTRFEQLIKDGVIPEIENTRTLRLLLRRYLEGISFPFHGEPLADVQITGVLETRAMDFDNVLLLNVEEGVVPNVSADLSYIPYYLRKAYGLETHEEATDVYAYNFFRLTYRAKKVSLLFTGSETGKDKKTMSRFLRQMMVSDNYQVIKSRLMDSNLLSTKPIAINHLPSYNASKGIVISPSSINDFRTCQMKYHLKHVLGVKELREQTALLGHDQIGTAVHKSLQYLYEKYQSPLSIPTEIPWDDIPAMQIEGNHPLETEVIQQFIKGVVALDKDLAREHQLEIKGHEKRVELQLDVDDIGKVTIVGYIDRIDTLDGVCRIIDYKTGSTIKDDYIWQILVYQLAMSHQTDSVEIQPVIYLVKETALKNRKTALHPVSPIPGFEAELKNTIKQMLSYTGPTMVPEKDKDKTCKFCPYLLLCNRVVKDY